MAKFLPDSFKPRETDIDWAIKKFNIDKAEVENQLEQLRDHEFRRNYTEWNRVFRNWFRTADKHQLLKREHKRRQVEVLTDEQRAEDIRKWEDDMRKLKVVR